MPNKTQLVTLTQPVAAAVAEKLQLLADIMHAGALTAAAEPERYTSAVLRHHLTQAEEAQRFADLLRALA